MATFETSAANAASNTDNCQRFVFKTADVRGEIVRLGSSYHRTVDDHSYPPAVRALLGEFLAASVLLGSSIKYDGRLVLQVRRGGELNLIMAECTSKGAVRGIARFDNSPQSQDFADLIGQGVLVITVDSGKGEPYQGIVSLQGGSLAGSLENYFQQSEQLQSWFIFAVDDGQVCGFMLQQLPAAIQKDPADREAGWEHLQTLAKTLRPDELLKLTNEELLLRLYHEEQVELFTPRPFHYECSCSRQRTAQALLSIGREEVDSIIAEHGAVDIACEFCGTQYRFDASEVALLMQERSDVLH